MLQVTTNVDGANSTKPLLPAGAVHLVECLIGTLKKFKIKALGGLSKTHK
jgi:hypothetical protein